jgi:hypothetical protein
MRLHGSVVGFLLVLALLPGSASAHGVQGTLDALAGSGELGPELHTRYTRDWSQARGAVRHLHGSARAELQGVLSSTWSLARRDLLAGRLTPVFLTIERNYEWFWVDRNGPAAYGARRSFDGSPLIFEFYPGSGWQIQPLANFGRLGGLASNRRTDPATLSEYADALLPLAVQRDGFPAFEYYFPWSGGRPGWISGMATATGIQALGRVWQRTGQERYRDLAEAMLGAFFRAPPVGVRLYRGHGRAHYLQYSQAPHLLVGNAFAQSLIALDEFTRSSGSARAGLALERGLRQADAALRRFDTGAWSLYWRRPGGRHGGESDLHYHQLFESFLAKLCPRFPDGPFCGLRERFARYETEPVRIGPLRARRHGRMLRIRAWTSKRGTGRLTILHGTRVVHRSSFGLSRGIHVLERRLPRGRRTYTLRLEATSLNGNVSAKTTVSRPHSVG